jgi:hypothetical protein
MVIAQGEEHFVSDEGARLGCAGNCGEGSLVKQN